MVDEFNWVDFLASQLGIEANKIPIVVISAIGIYVTFMVLVKIFGSRVLTSLTASDAVIVIMFGAVAGRVIIGHPPTLMAGIIGLATLMALEAIFGAFRHSSDYGSILDRRPVLVVAHGRLIERYLRSAHVNYNDVATSARKAGVGTLEDITAMVLEPNGSFSVIKRGQPISAAVFRGVKGGAALLQCESGDGSEHQ